MAFHDDLFSFLRTQRTQRSTLFPYTTLFRSKYNTSEIDYTITVNSPMAIENAINAMIRKAKHEEHYKKGDKITIVASHPNFNHNISTVVKSDVKAQEFMDQIANILSSNEEMDITQTKFNVKIINLPRGAKPSKIINLVNDMRTKQCITQIKNSDNLCCPRAIVTALTYHYDNILDRAISKKEIPLIRKGKRLQGELARELCNRLGEYNEEGFTLEDIRNAESLLNIQIKVVCAENFNTIIYTEDEK